MNLLELAHHIEEQTDIDAIWAKLQTGLAPLGIKHLIYITVDKNFENPFLLTTMSRLFENVCPADDPFLHWCCNTYAPTFTGAEFLDEHGYLPETARLFVLRARELGFLSGIALPVRLTGSERFGGFNLGTGLSRSEFNTRVIPNVDRLSFLCLLAHRRIEEMSDDHARPAAGFRPLLVAPESRPAGLDELTPREREVLFLIARGLSRKECARMCKITVNTVSEYAKSAYRKLGLRNRAEAAAIFANLSDPEQ